MKKYRNKLLPVLAAAVLSVLLSGFTIGKSSVELRSEEPLIDLGSFVKDSPIGKEESSPAGTETSGSDVAETQETKKAAVDITVEITHNSITVNGERCRDAQEALEKVKGSWKVGMKVYLIDNYAQYTTYTDMYQALRKASMQVVEKQK